MQRWLPALFLFAFYLGLMGWRRQQPDPRGSELVGAAIVQRETDSFRDRLRRGDSEPFPWPGLRATQSSVAWLETLSGLHNAESYRGDFSWMFSKLDTLVSVASPEEIDFLSSLAPFYFVMGHDGAGSTLVMNELINRCPQNYWRPLFWSGFHALENLGDPRLAGDLMGRAARVPASPDFLAALSLRLEAGREFLNARDKRKIIESDVDPVLVEKIRRSRPEWFQD
ncbi:MAG: hypothetical protein JST16_12115 [Bdellovibrionales bacterium]|nr:hypothetical protein [Bdellovibrionales bacterium]